MKFRRPFSQSIFVAFHYWFGFLDKRFPGTSPKSVVTKTALDQLLSAPVGLAMYFSATSLLEGHSIDYVNAKFRTDYWKSLEANYVLWPAAHLINFRLIPPRFRIIYVNCAHNFGTRLQHEF